MNGNVLVVGGGIAGLALARALSQRGLPVSVVERATSSPGAGLGLNLPANAVRALAALGVADEVVDRGVRVRRREYRNSTGRLLFAVDEEAFWRGVGPSVCLRRSDLHTVLLASTTQVPARWGTSVRAVEPVPDRVRVVLDGAPAETYDLVVGADGVHSTVRGAVTGEAAARPSLMTQASWRFLVANPGVDCWTVWSGAHGTLLLIPVDGSHAYGYASTTRGGAAAADPSWLRSTFAGFAKPVPSTVAAVLDSGAELYHSPVEEVRCEPWTRDRVVLIGDAAHAIGPVWAQGAALALEDALVLADLLGTRSDWASAGREFERRRRPRVEHVRAATDRMSRLAGLPSLLRDAGAPVLGPRAYRATYGPLRAPVTAAGS